MLKTRAISSSATSPRRCTRPKTGGTGQRVGHGVREVVAQPLEVVDAAAGDVREPMDRDVGAQQLEHGAHVDDRGLEQDVGDAAAAELRRAVVVRERRQRAARERVAVGVQAARRQADERVAGRDVLAGDDRVEARPCR
jgi:hypothetical protein